MLGYTCPRCGLCYVTVVLKVTCSVLQLSSMSPIVVLQLSYAWPLLYYSCSKYDWYCVTIVLDVSSVVLQCPRYDQYCITVVLNMICIVLQLS